MHFEAEIAVFQASFYCGGSDEIVCPPCSRDSERVEGDHAGNVISVRAVCHAVREIVHGLESDRGPVEKRLWNFKLHAILFWKLLKRRTASDSEPNLSQSPAKCEAGDCWLGYFEGVSHALPDQISLCLYLEIVRNLHWEPICAEVLRSLGDSVAQDLLADMTAECIAQDSPDLLLSILTCLLCPAALKESKPSAAGQTFSRENGGIAGSARGTDYHGLVVIVCEQVLAAEFLIESRSQRWTAVRSLLMSLGTVVSDLCGRCEKTGDSERGSSPSVPCWRTSAEARNEGERYSDDVYYLHLLGGPHREECLRVIERDRTAHGRARPGSHCNTEEVRARLLEVATRLVSTLHGLLTGSWRDALLQPRVLDSSGPHGSASEMDCVVSEGSQLLTDRSQEVLRRLYSVLEQSSWPVDTGPVQEQCLDLAGLLSGGALAGELSLAANPPVAVETAETTNRQAGEMWLREAVSRVDERLEGYEDDLSQLLSASDQWEEESWIECLERNTLVLALPRFVEQLIDVVMAVDAREAVNEILLQRVLKVLLVSYSSLPLLLQNKLRDRLFDRPAGPSIFARHGASTTANASAAFDQEATLTFNRLVTLARGQDSVEVLTSLSCLALQSPVRTLQQAVGRAVSNAAVCRAVCQALQTMPSLATFRPRASDEWPLLCHLIHEATETLATSANEEANLVQLVTALLKPYKPLLDPECPVWCPPVLSASGVAQVCSLPHLSTGIAQTGSSGGVVMAMRFLAAVLDAEDARSREGEGAVAGASPFPIMLCLCEILDRCQVLWDGNVAPVLKTEVKEVTLGIMGRIGQRIRLMPTTKAEKGLEWILDRASVTLHWTTVLTLRALLPECSQCPKQLLPECVIRMCHLPDSEWSPIAARDSQPSPIPLSRELTDIMLFCRASDKFAAILSQGTWEPSRHRGLGPAVPAALAQVMPQCMLGEWQRIVGWLTRLLTGGVLTVPCTARYTAQLPLCDISGFRVHLSLSQLLLSTMELLTGPCCQEWASPHLLHHVTRCYVDTMQSLTSDMLNSDLRQAPGCLFAIGQLLCHACEVTGAVATEELKEQVFVLMLEVLTRMQEGAVTRTDQSRPDLGFEWANQRGVLELLANQMLAGEQRKTLLQKLSGLKERTVF